MRVRAFLLIFVILPLVPSTAFSSNITADYLIGPWCHSYSVSGTEKIDENYNYVFQNDGTYSHQGSSHSKKLKHGFRYEILPGKLKLQAFPGDLQVKSVQEDELVLKYFVDLHFIRGECG